MIITLEGGACAGGRGYEALSARAVKSEKNMGGWAGLRGWVRWRIVTLMI